jgi:hypothetical protein
MDATAPTGIQPNNFTAQTNGIYRAEIATSKYAVT